MYAVKFNFKYFFLHTCCKRACYKAEALQAQNTWRMRRLVYIENRMGKSPIEKKNV